MTLFVQYIYYPRAAHRTSPRHTHSWRRMTPHPKEKSCSHQPERSRIDKISHDDSEIRSRPNHSSNPHAGSRSNQLGRDLFPLSDLSISLDNMKALLRFRGFVVVKQQAISIGRIANWKRFGARIHCFLSLPHAHRRRTRTRMDMVGCTFCIQYLEYGACSRAMA